ncbi:LytR C-terminal domain-containing protein [Kitasatospora sp. NBC_00039]|uniref:LCP family protein n=1 Tax=Kitasatospora sp. NBC_00039 TaxID=2903565 RepID=UPI00324BF823
MSDRRGPQDDWSTGQYPQHGQQYDQYGQPVQGGGYEQQHGQQYDQYDQYGQPVQQPYGQDQYAPYPGQGQDQYQQAYQPYGQPVQGGGYEQQHAQQYDQYDQYGQPVQQPYGQDQYAPYPGQGQDQYQQAYQPYEQPQQYATGAMPVVTEPEPGPAAAAPTAVPAAAPVPPRPRTPRPAAAEPPVRPEPPSEQVGGSRAARAAGAGKAPKDDYPTGEFTFVDEEAEESEDVIDWLKFAESRSEVRAERRRKLRNRLVGVGVVLALAAAGTGGYLWFTGADKQSAATAAGPRQVNVVHLRDLQGKVSSALLVNDSAGHKGTVLLLPDTLRLPGPSDPPVTTVGQAMDSIGPSAARDGLTTVLGAPVAGTWRLDTPYLELLVAQLGGVRVDTNAETHEGGKPDGKLLSAAGKNTLLSGKAAVAYATLQAAGENRDTQLARFGQVLDAVVRTMPTDFKDAKDDVHRMNAVLDPSLPEDALAGVLGQLAQQAKDGHLATTVLTVKPDGSLDDATAGKQVKDVLGSTVKSAVTGDAPARVAIQDATGNDQAAAAAQVQVVNAGLTFIPGGAKTAPQAASEIRYTDDARQAAAKSLAISLNLPETAAKKVTDAQNADLVVVLGKDYQPPKAQ